MTQTMETWRVHEYGSYKDQLTWETCDRPQAGGAAAVIKVQAAGVNFPDLLAISGQYQMKAPMPFIPGQEAMGIIEEAAPDGTFKPGDRVMTINLCGAYAPYMMAVDDNLFRVPEGMPDAEAAAFMMTYGTSYCALTHRGHLQRGETLLVHGGAGGVGTAAIQLGKALGATVIATAGSNKKLQVCRDCGADHAINYSEEDFVPKVKELTGGRGADVIYDPVGGDVFDKSSKCIAWEGRLLVIGFASGRIPSVAANRILLKNCAYVGVFWGAYQFHNPALIARNHDILCGLYAEGKIRPVIYKEYPLKELPAALDAIESRTSYGKIIIRP